ncbi:hypothetical protein [Nocardiopsis dassonvillei]|uniref:hypothetical protein n=1 Tax=Nocardiopsis dassonvillei TaxID=2014 RepID=UPI00157BD4E8|nr:hypothetical protein [Nocardiopsis dassonvillei]
MVLRTWRGLVFAGAGVAWLGAAAWSVGKKAWKHVLPYAKRAGKYLAGAWSELLLKSKRDREEDKLKRDFEPGKSGKAPGNEVARRMSGASHHRVMLAAHELANALSAYNEEGMLTYVEGLDALPEALNVVANGINNLSVSALEEQPLDPRIADFIAGIAAGQGNIALAAQNLRPLAEDLHAEQLYRLREQHGRNEHKWDRAYNAR